jgi:hypothetical protein
MTTVREMLDALEVEYFGFVKNQDRKVEEYCDEIDELVAQQEFADKVLSSRTFIQGNAL